ncbi:hypothetical protein CHL78_007720 [Romboutsia weinsteinii]|uniref:Uncharacterized protein n=1 Tax=Romboutsia weinsteinii TaxID=2020949 RepID=A0A371J5C4_9FIRM|nr:hypothetical protein [Romboutsia weinsteinii]RDY27883.1 hypothetical protein CHL78_007720 [Romboutsia weinsteinii]
MGKYKLDYFSKYYFYEEDNFVNQVEDGEYILSQIKISNRFDYKGNSYKYTKFGNLCKSDTMRDVDIELKENDINVIINGEVSHLDLIYKFETRELEDHVRIATRISEKTDDISCLLYINYDQAKEFIKDLEDVRELQKSNMNK